MEALETEGENSWKLEGPQKTSEVDPCLGPRVLAALDYSFTALLLRTSRGGIASRGLVGAARTTRKKNDVVCKNSGLVPGERAP
jgi:hypothetical protein